MDSFTHHQKEISIAYSIFHHSCIRNNGKDLSLSFPALNINHRNEPVATYTVYCDTSATYDGSKCAQVFVGTKTLVSDFHRMKHDKKFVKSLEDNIRKRGAIDKPT